MSSYATRYLALGWLLLALAVALGALWQREARGRQLLDVGAPLDEGAVAGFYGRELSDLGASFRWSRPEAELRMRPAPAPAALRMRLLAPAAAEAPPAALTLTVAGQALGPFAVAPDFRVYTLLLPPGESRVGLSVTPLSLPGDPRALGLVLDWAELRALAPPSPASLAGELVAFPLLPLGLLLVAATARLAGARQPAPGLAALAALGLLAAAAAAMPGAALPLAWALTVGAGAVAVGLAAWRALERGGWGAGPAADRRAVAWLCAAWALAFALAFAPWVASDGTGYYAYTRSLALDGDLDFANEYRDMPFPHTPVNPDQLVVPATGLSLNPFSIGPGLLWLPGFALAHLFVGLGPGAYWPADGYSLPYVALTTLASALAGLALLLTLYRICRRVVGPGLAALAGLAVFLGANPLYYTLREPSFAHGVSAAAAALFVLAWLRLEERPSPRRWAAVGAAGGLSALLYWTSALALLPAALSFGKQLAAALGAPGAERGRQLRELALGAGLATLCGLAMVAPQLVAWQIIFGAPLTVPQGTGFITPGAPVVLPFLFGPLHGMLLWTPAYFVGMLGLGLLATRRPWAGLALGLGFAAYLFYNMSLSTWHGGGALGMRRLTVPAPWCALGLALVFDRLARLHRALPVAAASLMAAWTTLLAVRYDLYLIDRNVGSLEDMPALAFLLGRDALPLGRLADWAASGFYGGAWNLARAGAPWAAVLALVALVTGLAAAGVAMALRLVAPPRPAVAAAPAPAPGADTSVTP